MNYELCIIYKETEITFDILSVSVGLDLEREFDFARSQNILVGVYVTLNAEVGIVLRIGAKIAVDSHIGIDSTFDSALDVFANGIRQSAVVEDRDFFADVFYESFVGNTVGLVDDKKEIQDT